MEDKLFFLVRSERVDLLYQDSKASFEFTCFELLDGFIYNSTKVAAVIFSYLIQKKLLKKPGIVIFDDSLLVSQLLPKSEQYYDLGNMYVKTNLNQDWWYLATLKPGIYLQYQLLFRQIGLYIEIFTSDMVLQIKHLLDQKKQDLSQINDLDKLQSAVKYAQMDLYHGFVQAVAKI